MAQNTFINVTAGTTQEANSGSWAHKVTNGASAANDLTISYDSAKFTSKSQIYDAIIKAANALNQNANLK